MACIVDDSGPLQTGNEQDSVPVRAPAIDESALGTLASTHDFSANALLNRDYKRCADMMINKYGPDALFRAERRARHMLGDDNHDGYDIWTRVAATIRWIQ